MKYEEQLSTTDKGAALGQTDLIGKQKSSFTCKNKCLAKTGIVALCAFMTCRDRLFETNDVVC